MMSVRNLSVFVIIASSMALQNYGVQSQHSDGWVKLNTKVVCFGARDNKYGSFINTVQEGIVAAIKLVYLHGHVRCDNNAVHDSRWGCGRHTGLAKIPLGVIGTDQNNRVLFPNDSGVLQHNSAWYSLPFADTLTSDELVFTQYAHSFFFPLNKEMRLWYGEDLRDVSESDNHGLVCVNVYAMFV